MSRQTLLAMCAVFRGKPDRYPNLTIKKIPEAVPRRCEWGKDDYSLQVENLPKAPPPKGQLDLIPADGDEAKQQQSTRENDAWREAK